MNDASCYEPQTREQLVNNLGMTGEDALSLNDSLDLLHLAHIWAASELKSKYSILCSVKLEPSLAVTALEGAVKSDDRALALDAFRLVRTNMAEFVENMDVLESLPKIITAVLELTFNALATRQ